MTPYSLKLISTNRHNKWNTARNCCFLYFLQPVFTYFLKTILPQSPSFRCAPLHMFILFISWKHSTAKCPFFRYVISMWPSNTNPVVSYHQHIFRYSSINLSQINRNIGFWWLKLSANIHHFNAYNCSIFNINKSEKLFSTLNPLSTTGLLTSFVIGSYHEIFTCLANHNKATKMLHRKLSHETSFLNTLSDWFNKW